MGGESGIRQREGAMVGGLAQGQGTNPDPAVMPDSSPHPQAEEP